MMSQTDIMIKKDPTSYDKQDPEFLPYNSHKISSQYSYGYETNLTRDIKLYILVLH